MAHAAPSQPTAQSARDSAGAHIIRTITDASGRIACELRHQRDPSDVLHLEMLDMKHVTQADMRDMLGRIGDIIKHTRARDHDDDDSGLTLVFDAKRLKHVNVFDFVPMLKQWASDHAKFTEASVRCTFIRVSTKEWRDIFTLLLKLFKHTRPVHVVTRVEYDLCTRRPRIPEQSQQRKHAQQQQKRAHMEAQRSCVLRASNGV